MSDIIIIGSGPGGCAAAFRAAEAGLSVTLVEQADTGGVCLNRGCIPTKTLKASADALEMARRLAEYGIAAEVPPQADVDGTSFRVVMPAVLARKEKVQRILRDGLEKSCAARKIRLVRGRAECLTGRGVRAHTTDGVTEIHGDALILATGSTNLDLPSLPVDHACILNSDDALNLAYVPKRALIVGGGVIGCEFAFILRSFGAEVTLVEGFDRLLPLPSVDTDISALLRREAKKRGIQVMPGHTVKSAAVAGGQATCLVVPSLPGRETLVETDIVLVAAGRRPNTQGLNLAAAGVETDAKGWILADDGMRTSADGIYAIGDVLGPGRTMLAHAAAAEGVCAVDVLLGKSASLDYSAIPYAVFTSPEIGAVGLTEALTRETGLNARSSLVQVRELGKAHAMGELSGFFKIVCEENSGRLLGAHIAGAHAADCIAEAALAIKNKLTVMDMVGTVHAHPTLAEGLYEAAAAWLRARNVT
jgi:dihydrolipoamide dehydrogenase